NFDKTITTIPTYALISESYRNWRGMSESGGRRIMRSIIVDQRSVKFCTPEMLDKFREFKILRDYIDERLKEIEEFNLSHGLVNDIVVNGRKMTNLGMFRKYIEFYLKNHRFIRQDMTLLV
ncbi:mechanosensitive ion channel, partial [Arthrospira platensis SPKY1]|nr:mechanosensitive ion channel [Arthrospira platensis SPKY1]